MLQKELIDIIIEWQDVKEPKFTTKIMPRFKIIFPEIKYFGTLFVSNKHHTKNKAKNK